MPAPAIIDQPPEALDKVYAQSLFELAEAEGGRPRLEEISDEIDHLFELRGMDPQGTEFFRSRLIPAAEKIKVLQASLGGKITPLLLKTTLLLARKERLDRMWRVFTAFQQMLDEKFGKIEVDVFTRFPLPPEEVERLRVRLQNILKREPIMHAYTDEAMIGGLKIQVGDKIMDASITTTLRRMCDRLIESGSDAVRARADRIIEDK
ncbi:MAG: ATP synthase F1 subunit delta [Phycisphaerae bacterium]|nr:ATP synthase F1 subunit delta [Phycisphaerae bacterium]